MKPCTLHNLKGRFLAAIGHVPADESASAAFDRLRATNPDFFPVPRCDESFWDAISAIVSRHEASVVVRHEGH